MQATNEYSARQLNMLLLCDRIFCELEKLRNDGLIPLSETELFDVDIEEFSSDEITAPVHVLTNQDKK